MRPRWDIFCKVIDNLGDIGVAWRLARLLADEHGLDVRLWVDDLAALERIWPSASAVEPVQPVSGVEVRHWRTLFPATEPGDVVIETFQCAVPESYLVRMAAKSPAPVWINLDYLSAEAWVSGCHRLPSPHPRFPLTKYFYFPGFEATTGGLLRERNLDKERATFLGDREGLVRFWAQHGLKMPLEGERRVSLFCYPEAPVADLLQAWSHSPGKITALMPEGPAADRLRAFLGLGARLHEWIERGSARLKIVPFTDQTGFDRLMWACDVNFVRGEDSFVRAQWARRPLIWNIYPQAENAHWIKLHAFLDRFTPGLAQTDAEAVRKLWRVWNGIARPAELARAWNDFAARREAIAQHMEAWACELARQNELAAGLVEFCSDVGKFKVHY